jgi:hypothetical protein
LCLAAGIPVLGQTKRPAAAARILIDGALIGDGYRDMDVQALLGRVDRFQRRHPGTSFPLAVFKKFGEDQAANLAALIAY